MKEGADEEDEEAAAKREESEEKMGRVVAAKLGGVASLQVATVSKVKVLLAGLAQGQPLIARLAY